MMNDDQLFQEEQETLRIAQAVAADEKYQGNEILPAYRQLISQYDKLLKATRKIFRISDNQGKVLHQQQTEMQTLLDNANQGFLTFGPDLKVGRQFSAECSRIFRRNIAGISILELLTPPGQEPAEHLRLTFTDLFRLPVDHAASALKNLPPVVKINDRDIRIECKFIFHATNTDEHPLLMMMLTDITEILKAEEEIHYLSYHDKLTGLYNRAYVEKTLLEIEQTAVSPLSVIVIDMNGLKITNDMFGHEQGDRLLVAMAQVLKDSCRPEDVVARWGGDEFLVLLPGATVSICQQVCERIKAACTTAGAEPIRLSAAIGAATGNGPVRGLTELFSVAENRMYSNKMENSREVRASIIADVEAQLQNSSSEPAGQSRRARLLAAEFAEFLSNEPELAEKFLEYMERRK